MANKYSGLNLNAHKLILNLKSRGKRLGKWTAKKARNYLKQSTKLKMGKIHFYSNK